MRTFRVALSARGGASGSVERLARFSADGAMLLSMRAGARFSTIAASTHKFAPMNVKVRNIEVDAETADLLEARAAARGISVAELLAEIANERGADCRRSAVRAIAEGSDRRWAKVASGEATVPHGMTWARMARAPGAHPRASNRQAAQSMKRRVVAGRARRHRPLRRLSPRQVSLRSQPRVAQEITDKAQIARRASAIADVRSPAVRNMRQIVLADAQLRATSSNIAMTDEAVGDLRVFHGREARE